MNFNLEETINYKNINSNDRYVFDIDTLNKLPIFPIVKNDLHYILRANVNPIEEEVYNIKKDPSEIHNIINHIPKDKLKELKSSFYKYQVSKVFYEKYKVK